MTYAYTKTGWDGKPLLTPAELETVRRISQGLTAKEIAAALGKSHKTIENQTHGVLFKLRFQGIRRRLDLVRWAVAVNLTPTA